MYGVGVTCSGLMLILRLMKIGRWVSNLQLETSA
jgi:hypothetical protein